MNEMCVCGWHTKTNPVPAQSTEASQNQPESVCECGHLRHKHPIRGFCAVDKVTYPCILCTCEGFKKRTPDADVTGRGAMPLVEEPLKLAILDLRGKLADMTARAETAEGKASEWKRKHETVVNALCPQCGRSLQPDGDCYGCAVDGLQERLRQYEESTPVVLHSVESQAQEIERLQEQVATLRNAAEDAEAVAMELNARCEKLTGLYWPAAAAVEALRSIEEDAAAVAKGLSARVDTCEPAPNEADTISDGCGNEWPAKCHCGGAMQIVRPGDARCERCDSVVKEVAVNVSEIVKEHLGRTGFDGLFNPDAECACKLDDLAPCDGVVGECTPGYYCECKGAIHEHLVDGDWHITEDKPAPDPSPVHTVDGRTKFETASVDLATDPRWTNRPAPVEPFKHIMSLNECAKAEEKELYVEREARRRAFAEAVEIVMEAHKGCLSIPARVRLGMVARAIESKSKETQQ